MTTQRILLFSYLGLGVLVALVLEHVFGGPVASIRGLGFLSRSLVGFDTFWALIAGVVATIGIGLFCWFDQRVKGPATQVVEELQRVTWPTVGETRAAAVAVVVASIICAVLLGAFDYGWGLVTKKIYAESETSQTRP